MAFPMTSTPNRSRNQQTGSEETRRKQSGDQHTDLLNENSEAPGQPHCANRIDGDKNAGRERADNGKS